MAENNIQPTVGTNMAKSIPVPMHKARNPINLFFLKKLITTPPLDQLKKQLYKRYEITATSASSIIYHSTGGSTLEIMKMARMMHKIPAYLLYVYRIEIPPKKLYII